MTLIPGLDLHEVRSRPIPETEVASGVKYRIAVETAASEAKITLSLEAVLT